MNKTSRSATYVLTAAATAILSWSFIPHSADAPSKAVVSFAIDQCVHDMSYILDSAAADAGPLRAFGAHCRDFFPSTSSAALRLASCLDTSTREIQCYEATRDFLSIADSEYMP